MCEIFPEVDKCCFIFSLRLGLVFIAVLSVITGGITLSIIEHVENASYGSLKNVTDIRDSRHAVSAVRQIIPSGISCMAVMFMFMGMVLLFSVLANQEDPVQIFVWAIFFTLMVGYIMVLLIGLECIFRPVCTLSSMDWLTGSFVLVMIVAYLFRLQNVDIANLLNDSDLEDFTPSDEDTGDPPFVIRPENRCSSSSETDEDEDVHISSRSANRGSRSSRSRSRGRAHGFRNASVRSRTTQEVGTVQPFVDGTSSGLSLDVPSTNGWTSGSFAPKELVLTEPSYLIVNSQDYEQIDYFRQYIDDDLVKLIVEKTNQTAVKLHGRSLNLDLNECYVYIGITMVMASVNFPNLRMYWENQWRVNIIASNMSRNRFTQLRNAMKLVFDDDVTLETRNKDKLWKVRPLIERMQEGCMAQDKQQKLCIDEMIVPFSGSCGIKQYCPGKPNPEGLKIFVLANPDGLVCDFHVYEGSTTYPDYEESHFGLGEKAVLTLAKSLVPGHVLYFDRYFTSQKLLDKLLDRGIGCSGTIMKNRIPAAARPDVVDDRILKDRGRGSNQVLVRQDGKIALTKWFDNKAVTLLSSVEASEETDICRRWCKRERRYLPVNRPRVIRNYNMNMGGVDLADRMLAVCPYRYRTKKWTQRFISHMIDLAVTNSWIQYKKDQIRQNVPIKKILQLRGFKNDLGELLIETYSRPEATLGNTSDSEQNQSVQRKRGKPTDPLPSKRRRLQGADHMPIFHEKQSRCRHCHYKKSRITCSSCKITLCLTSDRNCFLEFHS